MYADNYAAIFMAFAVVCINTYYVYRVWFDPENLRNFLIQRQKRLPNWYPLRNYALQRLQKPGWIYEIRILSIASSVFTIIFVGLVIAKLIS
jgi:hypothetical protein